MASKTVQPIAIKLGIEGGEKLAALNRSFRDLSKQVKLSDADITQATKDIVKFATEAGNSEATIKGQIKAFEGLREQAALGGKAYTELTQGISKLQSTLRGSSDAVERERSNLVKLGSASKNSAKDLQYVIGQLEKLKSKVREDSAAFLQLGKDIKNLNVNLKEVEISAGKARFAINTILSAKPEKITGQIEKLNAAIASGTLEAEDLNIALRKLELLKVGAGRGPVAFRADVFSSQLGVDYFARLRKEYDNLEKTQAAISQRISEVNTELQNVSGYERRRSLTLELIRLNKELQQSIVNVTTREQFQAMAIRQRMGSARESYAASGFGAFSAEIRQRTAGGEFTPGMQRARERARNEIINEEAVRATTDIFDTWEQAYGRIEDAARGHKTEMARIQAAQGQLLIEKQNRINDELLRSNQAAYDKEVAEFDARLNRIEKLKSGEFASRQALGLGGGELSSLYGNIVGIGTSYARGQQEMMGRSPIQVFNDITSTFNRDLRRSGDARIEAERQLRDNLVREFGAGSQRLKAALERIPVGQMTTAQLPGAGEDLSAYVRRIEASTRGLEGVLTGFGRKTTNELRQARQSLVLFRDELDPTTASFERLEREAVASISRIDKELEKRQMGRRRRMSPMQMTQAAGAAISGGIFGGPEGFLGGAIGAIGGVGTAFAGAAAGAQVAGIRKQISAMTEYAAQIQKMQIALRELSSSQEEYNKAIDAASFATQNLNVPQDLATESMTKLLAAVKGAGGGVNDAQLAFLNFTAAIKASGGSAEQVEGAMTALVQIFSKGKVSAEEINQIAERLPGTFNLFAEAAGKTGPELAKALQEGSVGLNELMSLVVMLGERNSETALKISASSEEAGARLRVAYMDAMKDIGAEFQGVGAEFQDSFTKLIVENKDIIISWARSTASSIGAIASVISVLADNAARTIRAIIVFFTSLRDQAQAAIKRITDAWSAMTSFIANAFSSAAKAVGVDLGALSEFARNVASFFEEVFEKAFDFVQDKWAQTVKNIITLSNPIGWIGKILGVDIGEAAVTALQAALSAAGKKGRTEMPEQPEPSVFPGPTIEDKEDKGAAKAARDAERRAEEIARLKRAYDLLFAKRQILTVDMQLLDAARFIDQAQKENNAEAVDALRRKQSDLAFEKDLLAAKIEYDGTAREIKETLEGQQRTIAESTAQEQLRQSINVALGEQMSRILTIEQDITDEKKKQQQAIEAELTDRRRALGLISEDEYNAALMEREGRRLREQFPRATEGQRAEMLDLYRQEIDPTPFESMRQNITQLKDELRELVDPINQITGAATAIGDAFSQSFVDAISGSKTAKEALADFFSSVGSYFLDMAKQIIAKMIQIAILNSVAKLLPSIGGGGPLGNGVPANDLGRLMGPNPVMPRANGGPVNANQPYIVGERGPELFIPFQQGSITSNEELEAQMRETGSAPMAFAKAGADGKNGDDTISTSERRLLERSYADRLRETREERSYADRLRETREVMLPFTRNSEQASMIAAERETAQAISNPGPIDVRYESSVINGVEYITAEQHRKGMAQAAERGRALTLQALQGSVKTRKKVGL